MLAPRGPRGNSPFHLWGRIPHAIREQIEGAQQIDMDLIRDILHRTACNAIFFIALITVTFLQPALAGMQVEASDEEIVIQFQEPIGHSWLRELVSVELRWPPGTYSPDKLQVTGPDGVPVPFQIEKLVRASDGTINSGRLLLIVDLDRHARIRYRISQTDSPAPVTPTVTIVEDEYIVTGRPDPALLKPRLRDGISIPVEAIDETQPREKRVTISSGHLSVQLRTGSESFDEPHSLADLPAPLIAIVGRDQVARGRSQFAGIERCDGFEAGVVERGPLRVVYEAAYRIHDGGAYRQRWTIVGGSPYVTIDETYDGERMRGLFQVSLLKSFSPDHMITHGGSGDIFGRDHKIRCVEDRVIAKIGSHGLDNTDTRWVAFYRDEPGHTDMLLFSRIGGRVWDAEPLLIMERGGVKPDLIVAAPLRVRHRRWALAALRVNAEPDWRFTYPSIAAWPERHGLSPDTPPDDFLTLNEANNRTLYGQVYSARLAYTSLQQVLDEVYVWEAAENPERPRVSTTPAGLTALRAKIQTEPHSAQWKALSASLTDVSQRVGRMEIETAERLERAALVAAVNEDQTLTTNVLQGIDTLLERTTEDFLLYGPEFPTALDIRSRGLSLSACARSYDLACSVAVPEATRDLRIRSRLAFWAYRLSDPDVVPPGEPVWPSSDTLPESWNAARYGGLADFAGAFPNHPSSAEFEDTAYLALRSGLETAIRSDGTFAEAPARAESTARIWLRIANSKKEPRWNLYLEPSFRRFFTFLRDVHVPPMPAVGTPAALPALGDLSWRNQARDIFSIAAPGFAKSDPTFARELQWVWERKAYGRAASLIEPGTGETAAPVVPSPTAAVHYSEPSVCPEVLLHNDSAISGRQPQIGSRTLEGFGAVLRHFSGTDRETYVVFKAGPGGEGYHNDEGAFSFVWHGVPISCDAGTDPTSAFVREHLKTSSAHNVVTFARHENGLVMTPRGETRMYGRLRSFASRDDFSVVVAELSPVTGNETWLRALLLIEDEYLIVVDSIRTRRLPPTWRFHAFTDEFRQLGNERYDAPGRFGADLQLQIISPAEFQFSQRQVPQSDFGNHAQARLEAKRGFSPILAALRPTSGEADPFTAGYTDGILALKAGDKTTTVRWDGLAALLDRGELPSPDQPLTIHQTGPDGREVETTLGPREIRSEE